MGRDAWVVGLSVQLIARRALVDLANAQEPDIPS